MERNGIMNSILIIEDERAIAELLKYGLEKEGMQASIAEDGKTAFRLLEEVNPDLILLDLMLPDMDGLTICKEVTRERKTPIIIVSAKNDQLDKLIGLEYGADDYITKPFDIREVILRIRSVLRRMEKTAPPQEGEIIRIGEVTLDEGRHQVMKNGEGIELTPKEFALLAELMKRAGNVLTRENLMRKVWGFEYVGDSRTVDIHVQRLRKKLNDEKLIQTVFGVGYKIDYDEA